MTQETGMIAKSKKDNSYCSLAYVTNYTLVCFKYLYNNSNNTPNNQRGITLRHGGPLIALPFIT